MKIVYTDPITQMLSVQHCVPKKIFVENMKEITGNEKYKMTDKQYVDRMMEDVPEGAQNIRIMSDNEELPQDRTFRNAWIDTENSGVEIEMVQAADIARDKIRVARQPVFEKLDVANIIATDRNDTVKQAEIRDKKDRLRDAPARAEITNASNPDELKSVMETIITEIESEI